MNSPVDIYQIHRTPYFRRLHRNDSEQFERLKKAYESIRSFDEKSLQIRVNKLRVEKLLQRIKESLPITKPGIRSGPKKKPPQIRCEELAKARQVRIEYSRQNRNSTPRLIEQSTIQTEWSMKKSQLNRRLDYGNKKSELNRSKIGRPKAMDLKNATPTTMRAKLQKLLVHLLSEDKPHPDVLRSCEEIAESQNHLYWDLMGAIKKQHQYIKRYDKFTKNLSNFALKTVEQHQYSHVEVFNSKTNIKPCDSEVLIRTFRYSDDDEYLPPPSESLLRIPPDLSEGVTDEIPTHDDKTTEELEECNNSITHLRITFPNMQSNAVSLTQNTSEKKLDLSQKFGEIIRKTVRKESAVMLTTLEKALKH